MLSSTKNIWNTNINCEKENALKVYKAIFEKPLKNNTEIAKLKKPCYMHIRMKNAWYTQAAFICSKSKMKTEKGVIFVNNDTIVIIILLFSLLF